MLIFGDPIIDWTAIWKIVVVALIGGCGVVVVYGFLLLGVKYAGLGDDAGKTHTETSKVIGYAIAGVCAILVVGVIVLGIYAMTQKS
jgi:hypothetical protein